MAHLESIIYNPFEKPKSEVEDGVDEPEQSDTEDDGDNGDEEQPEKTENDTTSKQTEREP